MSSLVNKRLAVLTSGGDSPSMNAAIYGFVAAAKNEGVEVYGVVNGYQGFIDGNFVPLDLKELKRNLYLAGTCIGSSRCLAFKNPDVRKVAVEQFKNRGIDGLFVIGGDGSYMGAHLMSEIGCPVITAPGTIDNDVSSSQYTIGFFSALEEIYQAIKKIKATAESHSQITFVEVMGRHCHDLSVAAGLAGAADYLITNQRFKNQDELIQIIKDMIRENKKGIVIVVTERVYGPENGYGLPSLPELCKNIEAVVGRPVRFNVLGYTQRGATPTSWDLFVAQRFGLRAFQLALEGKWGNALGFDGFEFYTTPLHEAVNKKNKPASNDLIDFVNSSYKI